MSTEWSATVPPINPVAMFVGEDRVETPLRHLSAGMRLKGWEVDEFDSQLRMTRFYNFWGKIANTLDHRKLLRLRRAELVNRAMLHRPDVIIFVKSIILTDNQVEILRKSGIKIGIWYPDVSFDHPDTSDHYFKNIDFFVTTKSFHIEYFGNHFPEIPIAFIPHGYCEGVHRSLRREKPLFDIVYIGNASAYKINLVVSLQKSLPDIRMGVSGNGWGDGNPWTQLPAMSGDAMSRLLGSARLALGIHHGPHGPLNWEDKVSARTFEIPACGTFMLHPDNSEVRKYYTPENEIGLFDGETELASAAKYWLADDQRRSLAAENAYKRAYGCYGYSNRGQEIATFLRHHVLESGN